MQITATYTKSNGKSSDRTLYISKVYTRKSGDVYVRANENPDDYLDWKDFKLSGFSNVRDTKNDIVDLSKLTDFTYPKTQQDLDISIKRNTGYDTFFEWILKG